MNLLTEESSPGWLVAVLAGVSLLIAVIGLPLARRAGRIRAERLRYLETYTSRRERARDRALFLAALLPSILVWLSVMGVSFRGLTGFAADYMRWDDWTNVIVPLSLDGVSVAFGAHAFRAVQRGRYPGRANRIVLAAAATSAVLNFVHAREAWSVWAGAYLAFMSIVGMAMFHEMLEQFSNAEVDEQELRSRTPRFGKRWLLAPVDTFLVWRMWIYDPPVDRRPATVRNALDHYAEVKARRRQRSQELADLKAQERRARIVRNAELAQARRAAQRGNTLAEPPAAGPVLQQAVDHDNHDVPTEVGLPLAAATNGHDHRLAPVAIPAVRLAGHAGKVGLTVPAPRQPADPPTNARQGSARDLAARWAPRAKRLVAERLEAGERVTSTMLRDLIGQQVAQQEGVTWRPSEGWAKAILRDVREELAQKSDIK